MAGRSKYSNISIHEDLIKKIDDFMENSKEGFTSRAEVISYALRVALKVKK
jgi:metal-responsive CopG/Arc/MetJ family transcriptional regulator